MTLTTTPPPAMPCIKIKTTKPSAPSWSRFSPAVALTCQHSLGAATLPQQARNSFNQRRIALFNPRPKLAENPSLVCLLKAFARSGACVDVLMPVSDRFPSVDDGLATRYPFPHRFSLWRGGVRTTLRSWWERVQQIQVDRMFAAGAYDLILGVDSAGLIKGYEYAKRLNVPLVYLSFEIFFRDELSSRAEIEEKERECIASQFADLVIIQDKWRAQLLATENRLSPDKFEYLPVSPEGSQRVRKSDYLRRRFNLSERQTLVLHSGSFVEWTYADELLENVATWPEDFVLVVHTKYKPGRTDRHIQAVQQAKLSNVVLSTEPLPVDEYEQLVASADIGLALYKPVPPSRSSQKNIQTIGLSSGKFSFYMKYGLPVISVGQQTYAQLLVDYAFGENLDSFSEMPAALNRVRSNYAHHRVEAQRLFSEKLDFDIHWPRLSARLLEVLK